MTFPSDLSKLEATIAMLPRPSAGNNATLVEAGIILMQAFSQLEVARTIGAIEGPLDVETVSRCLDAAQRKALRHIKG